MSGGVWSLVFVTSLMNDPYLNAGEALQMRKDTVNPLTSDKCGYIKFDVWGSVHK